MGDVPGFADVDDATLGRWFQDDAAYLVDFCRSIGVLAVGGLRRARARCREHAARAARPDAAPRAGGQADRLRAAPATWAARCVEEGLRRLSPFGINEKVTVSDAVLGGLRFPAGTEVGLMVGSANRDPSRWPERADQFDLDRPARTHVAFGHGTHFCIGHSVAKGLGQVAPEEMFTRLPGLRLDPDAEPVVHGWALAKACEAVTEQAAATTVALWAMEDNPCRQRADVRLGYALTGARITTRRAPRPPPGTSNICSIYRSS